MKKKVQKGYLCGILAVPPALAFTACKEPEPVVTPVLTGTVSINGTTGVGHTPTANTSSLGGNGAISYQWKRGNMEQ
jgi:hypothetical protein